MTTPEEFAEKMRNTPKVLDEREARRGRGWGWDAEDSHALADQYMCELLAEHMMEGIRNGAQMLGNKLDRWMKKKKVNA